MKSLATINRKFTDPEGIQAPVYATFDVLHVTADGSVAFAVRRPLLEGKKPLFFMACSNYKLAVSGEAQFELNDTAYYMSSFYTGSTIEEVVEELRDSERDMAAFGITSADLNAAQAAA